MKFPHSMVFAATIVALTGCFTAKDAKNPKTNQHMEAGKNGITIDATYDPRLDNLIPGYKIVTVALTNNGFDVLKLNPIKDRWEIVDAAGKNRRAINSIRVHSPSLFGSLPQKVQMLVDYPVGINVGYSETIDLFFPLGTDLRNFRNISFYAADADQKFDAMANLDSQNAIPVEQINAEAAAQNPKTGKAAKSGQVKP